jgi:apolipoprotein N-acyltransferase
VPWLAVVDRARTLRATLILALLMSVSFTLAVFGWFAFAVHTYTALPLAAAILLLAAVAPLVQPQFLTFAVARRLVRRRAGVAMTALIGACVYVGTEWAVPKLFGDTLGHCLYPSLWMRQAADLAGAPGLSFVLVIANACVLAAVDALTSRERGAAGRLRAAAAPVACVLVLAASLCAYGAVRLRQLAAATPANAPLTAGIVQANLSHYDRMRAELGTYETVRRVIDTHVAMSSELLARAPLDVLVWPETVYPTTFGAPKSEDGAAFDREIAAFVARAGVPLVFGSYDVENGDEYNAAFFLAPPAAAPLVEQRAAPSGEGTTGSALVFETYRKAWPFPLTERVPAFLDSPRIRAWLPWLGTWKPGAGPKVITLVVPGGRTIRVAPLICYDVLDPSLALAAVREGADLIITLSNDSWFANGAGPRLHLLGAAFRSMETRRPQLRATNTGVSAVIEPSGEITERAGVDERATLVASVVPGRWPATLVLAWGDWLGPVALLLGVALTAVVALTQDEDRRQAGEKEHQQQEVVEHRDVELGSFRRSCSQAAHRVLVSRPTVRDTRR